MKNRINKNNTNEIRIRKTIGNLLDENWKAVNYTQGSCNGEHDDPEDDEIIVWGDRIDQIVLGVDQLEVRHLL